MLHLEVLTKIDKLIELGQRAQSAHSSPKSFSSSYSPPVPIKEQNTPHNKNIFSQL